MNTAAPERDVLVVDDDASIREILVRWLEADGYRTEQAHDAETALALVERRQPSVVLCDIRMPGKDGIWLLGQLRQLYPNVAIVLATAEGEVAPNISLQKGVVGYVVKPFRREQLLTTVGTAAQWHIAARQSPPESRVDSIDEWLRGGGIPRRIERNN